MGLFPYFSPAERAQWDEAHKLEEQALVSRGYVKKDIITWKKDGKEFQVYAALRDEGIDTTNTKREFLKEHGYESYSMIEGDYYGENSTTCDYDTNIQKEQTHYEQYGFVPRWKKGEELFDWQMALAREGFSFKKHILKELD